jgi:NAD(P)H-hydrate epimerase
VSLPTISRQAANLLDRRAVEDYGMTGLVLMENAGRGVADRLCALGIGGPVVICCGGGNNGGDGFVVARHLDLRGHQVRVVLLADPAKLAGDAAINYRIVANCGIALDVLADAGQLARHLAGAAWIVDALLGTGARGEPRAPLAEAIERINAHGAPIMAVDLPSGLDCDSGAAATHTIRAAHTCTFVAQKPGFLAPAARRYTGVVHVTDIGAPRKLVDEILHGAAQ